MKKALTIYQDRWLNSFPTDEELIAVKLSDEFEQKMKKLITKQRKPYFYFVNTVSKRVASIILVLIMVFTTTVFSVKALREPLIDFFIQIYEKFSTIIFVENETTSIKTFEIFTPTNLPSDFIINAEFETDISYFREYTNLTGQIFTFEQISIQNTQVNIDTEKTTSEQIFINDSIGLYFEKDGLNSLVWNNEAYSFTVSGNIDKLELLEIAKSVKIM